MDKRNRNTGKMKASHYDALNRVTNILCEFYRRNTVSYAEVPSKIESLIKEKEFMRQENERLRDCLKAYAKDFFLQMRGIDKDRDQICHNCEGAGVTMTIIDGNRVTFERRPCSICHGSGIKDKPWPKQELES